MNDDKPWNTISKKTILERDPWLRVEEHAVELPDGRVIPDWTVVIIPDAVTVLARTADGKFLVFRQRKYAIEGKTLALPAGMLPFGEDPLEGGKRELREETGYEAPRWTPLGCFQGDPNRGVNQDYLFLAEGALSVCAPDADDLEAQELILLGREELERALMCGEFKAVMWSCTVAMGLIYLNRE
jgi:8-oxo-dGTP pyrophosphatase MutT (NUDIX family)